MRKLKAKGSVIVKDDPNAVKRKRANGDDITERVERNLSTPTGTVILISFIIDSLLACFSSIALILLKIHLRYQMKIQLVRRRSQLRKRGGNS